jgi:hypothetical protein
MCFNNDVFLIKATRSGWFWSLLFMTPSFTQSFVISLVRIMTWLPQSDIRDIKRENVPDSLPHTPIFTV